MKIPYEYIPVPVFNNDYEKKKYWEEEKRKCLEGYNGLTGKHFFYLSQCKIKDGTSGNLIRPFFRDCDQEIFESIDLAEKKGFELGIIKRREIGLTSIGGGCLPIYYMRFHPGSLSLITSCDKPRIFRVFEDKTSVVFDNLHPDLAANFIETNRNQTRNNVGLKAEVKVINDEGVLETRYSEIFCSETVTNPQAFSSARAKYGMFDELMLHPRREDLISSSAPCFMKGTERTGFLLWGGTVEDKIPQESINALRKLVADSKNSNTIIHFVPGWQGLFMENGFTNKKKGIEWIEKERERLSKLEDKTRLNAFIKNYPLTIEEALETSTEGALPPEVMNIVKEQRKIILKTQPPIANFDIINGHTRPNRSGKFTILTHPEKGHRYISGTDPIPFNDSKLTSGSDYTIVIKDYDLDTYVAYYAERSLNADLVINNCISLQDYYFKCQTMLEMNAGGVAYQKYKEYGRLDLLAKRPSSLGIKFTDANKHKFGFYKNDKISARLNDLIIKYILQYGNNIWFIRAIEELEVYLQKNTDIISAIAGCELMDADMIIKDKQRYIEPEYRTIMQVVREGGMTKWEEKKIRIK